MHEDGRLLERHNICSVCQHRLSEALTRKKKINTKFPHVLLLPPLTTLYPHCIIMQVYPSECATFCVLLSKTHIILERRIAFN